MTTTDAGCVAAASKERNGTVGVPHHFLLASRLPYISGFDDPGCSSPRALTRATRT